MNKIEQFFFDNAGYSYDPKTETQDQGRERFAKQYAAAEAWARDNGYSFNWEIDPGIDSSDFSNERPAWQLYQVTMFNSDGEVVDSMGGVDFGRDGTPWGDNYRRVCEAEMSVCIMVQAQEVVA